MAQPFKPIPTAVDRWTTEVKAYGVAEVALLSGLTLGVNGKLKMYQFWELKSVPPTKQNSPKELAPRGARGAQRAPQNQLLEVGRR